MRTDINKCDVKKQLLQIWLISQADFSGNFILESDSSRKYGRREVDLFLFFPHTETAEWIFGEIPVRVSTKINCL